MPPGVGIFIVAVVLITLGAQVATYRHLWPIVRRGWTHMGPKRRRRTVIFGLGELVLVGGILAVAIVAPFGSKTFAYLILGIAAVALPVLLVGVSVQARHDIRAARERRRASQQRDP